MPRNQRQRKGQRGGSDFMHSFYSKAAVGGPAAISKATLAGIKNAPMFNPLSASATIPGNSTGIVPSGLYLASQTGGDCGCQQGGCGCQSGGNCGRKHSGLDKLPTEQLRDKCNQNGISCRGQKGGYKHRNTLIKELQGN